MKLKPTEQDLLSLVKEALREVKRGNPLKDFMDEYDIEQALKLLVKLGKEIGK